jgi:hypothetical protein
MAKRKSRAAAVRGHCFTLTLVPLPGSDAIRNLRRALKTLLRRDHLRCVSIRPVRGRRA